jgi:BRCA2, oligonucleotide/oligosaccharide-binding, domain 1/BRCA2, helical
LASEHIASEVDDNQRVTSHNDSRNSIGHDSIAVAMDNVDSSSSWQIGLPQASVTKGAEISAAVPAAADLDLVRGDDDYGTSSECPAQHEKNVPSTDNVKSCNLPLSSSLSPSNTHIQSPVGNGEQDDEEITTYGTASTIEVLVGPPPPPPANKTPLTGGPTNPGHYTEDQIKSIEGPPISSWECNVKREKTAELQIDVGLMATSNTNARDSLAACAPVVRMQELEKSAASSESIFIPESSSTDLMDPTLEDLPDESQAAPLSLRGGHETVQGQLETMTKQLGPSPATRIKPVADASFEDESSSSCFADYSASSARLDSVDGKSPVSKDSEIVDNVKFVLGGCSEDGDPGKRNTPPCPDSASPAVEVGHHLLEDVAAMVDAGNPEPLLQQCHENAMEDDSFGRKEGHASTVVARDGAGDSENKVEHASTVMLLASCASSDTELAFSKSSEEEMNVAEEPTATFADAARVIHDAAPSKIPLRQSYGSEETQKDSDCVFSPVSAGETDEQQNLDSNTKTSESEHSIELFHDGCDSNTNVGSSHSGHVSLLSWQPITQQDDGYSSFLQKDVACDQLLSWQQPSQIGNVGDFFYTQASQSQEELSQGSQERGSDCISTSPQTRTLEHVNKETSFSPPVSEDIGDDANNYLAPAAIEQTAGTVVLDKTAGLGPTVTMTSESLAKEDRILGKNSRSQTTQVYPAVTATFRTAGSGSNIDVSSAAMAKAERICNTASDNAPQRPSRVSFQTASRGVALYVTDDSIAKASRKEMKTPAQRPARVSFQTADRGVALRVSHSGIAKANRLFGESSGLQQQYPYSNAKTPVQRTHMVSFQAAGSGVALEGSAISMAGALLEQISDSDATAAPTPHSPPTTTMAVFQTAGSGSLIGVSSAAIAKANRLLLGEPDSEMKTPAQQRPLFQTTGSGVTLQASVDSMEKVNSLLGGMSDSDASTPHSPPTTTAAFHTAGSGSMIDVSSAAIAKANRLLGCEPDSEMKAPAQQRPTRASFQSTGRVIALQASAASMAKANRLLGGMPDSETAAVSTPHSRPSAIPLFQTAGSGSLIQMSAAEMAKAERLCSTKSDTESKTPAQRLARVSFQTAGRGVPLRISDDSIAKANRLLGDKSNGQGMEHGQHPNFIANTPVHRPARVSFPTTERCVAPNRSVDSLSKASRLLGEISEAAATASNAMPSFKTAGSGSLIQLSSAAMAKASRLFEGGPDSELQTSVQRPPRASFQTAGLGITLHVSAVGMAKANRVLGEMPDSESVDDTPYAPPSDMPSFHSAETRSLIQVSAAALVKAEEIHSKKSITESTAPAPAHRPVGVSFQTAGRGVALQVSDDSLAKVNHLFGDTPGAQMMGDEPPATRAQRPARVSFQTAGRSTTLHASAASMAKANHILGGLSDSDSTGAATPHSPPTTTMTANLHVEESSAHLKLLESEAKTPASLQYPMFRTVGTCSAIDVSEASLAKANIFFTSETNNAQSTSAVPFQQASNVQCNHCTSVVPIPDPNDDSDHGRVGSPSQTQRHMHVSMGDLICRGPTQLQETQDDEVTCRPSVTEERVDVLHDAFKEGNMVNDPEQCLADGVTIHTLRVGPATSLSLRFDRLSGRPCGFITKTEVVPNNSVGSVSDIRKALNARGCDCSKISDKWILNHSRWIIWKLASIERRFSSSLAGSYLTFIRLLDQLEHRFEKEIRNGKRSGIRKVLNRDVASTTMMVLCVARVFELPKTVTVAESSERLSNHSPFQSDVNFYGMELTDGWYSVIAQPDIPLCRLIKKSVLRSGTKILVSDATLVGDDEGVDPLDQSYDATQNDNAPYLRLTVNATRLAHWRSKLGFLKPSRQLKENGGMLLVRKLQDVVDGGGSIPLLELTVKKKYQILYLAPSDSRPEKHMDVESSHSRFLTAEEELNRREIMDKMQINLVEKLSREVEAEVSQVCKRFQACPFDLSQASSNLLTPYCFELCRMSMKMLLTHGFVS